MKYQKFNNKILLRLDAGDEICDSILKLAEKEDIRLGAVSGIGGLDKLTVGVFNEEKKNYVQYEYSGTHEITSLIGNITYVDQKPYAHLHITAVGQDAKVVGGHLLSGNISLTAEIFIDVIEGEIGRTRNELLGINEMNL